MMNLKQILSQPLQQLPIKFAIAILIVALIGFADASYLTIEHFRGVIPPCTTDGCETVLNSAYSSVAGIPVSLLGSIYYLIMAIGIFAYIDSRSLRIAKWTLMLTPLGFLASIWFVVLQLFIVKAICQYCMLSAGTSMTLFILAFIVFKKQAVQNQAQNFVQNSAQQNEQ